MEISVTLKHNDHIAKVYYGLPETHGVSEMGHMGSGRVVHFGTPQHTATHTAVLQVFTDILVR